MKLFRKSPPKPKTEGLGSLTGCDLSSLAPVTAHRRADAFGRLRMPLSQEAAVLSLELSDTAYSMELDPWKQAGWMDFSILIDDSLQTGGAAVRYGTRDGLHKAVDALWEYNPVSQVMDALRQREKSDTVKAVCMTHPLPGGKWLLAIGFMGTGKHPTDWISNFRFNPESGFHRGFDQLCDAFLKRADSIVFPCTAEALGLRRLSLTSVLYSLASPESPFRLWMSGHSQGGAVMQIFTHRLLTEWGVPAHRMFGCGFASPTVAAWGGSAAPSAYPLYHILNRHDTVTRVGSVMHLGLCLEFPADDAFAAAVYPPPSDPELRQKLAFLTDGITDTPTALIALTAFLQCIVEEKGGEAIAEMMNAWWSIPAIDRLLGRAGDKAGDLLAHGLESIRESYRLHTGHPMNESDVAALRDRLAPIFSETPLKKLFGVLMEAAVPPHTLSSHSERARGCYEIIVQKEFSRLRPFVWRKRPDGTAVRQYTKRTNPARKRRSLPQKRGKLSLRRR